jgi:O-antigen/teichoic acid export membrane protein
VAQATAAIFGVVVAFGWGTVGAAMVASTPEARRPQMFLDSVVSRLYLFLFAAPVMFVLLLLLTRVDPVAAAVASLAYLMPFLGASWYFIGQAKPWSLLFFDVLPQGLGVITGVILLQFFPHAIVFAGSLLAFNVIAVAVGALAAMKGRHEPLTVNLGFVPAMQRLRNQKFGVIAAGTGTINSNLPMIAVSLVVPAAVPLYALTDKLFRFAVAGFGPVLQVVQGWIPEAGRFRSVERIQLVAKFVPAAGALGGVLLAVLIPWASPIFSRGEITVGYTLSVPFGLIFSAVLVAQVVGLACLIPLGEGAILAKSTALGAILNVPLMFAMGALYGGSGVAWAVGLSEVVVATYQVLAVRRHFRVQALKPVPASMEDPGTGPTGP